MNNRSFFQIISTLSIYGDGYKPLNIGRASLKHAYSKFNQSYLNVREKYTDRNIRRKATGE